MMDTATAAGAVGGSVIGVSVPIRRVTTDTRDLVPGDLFVALRGERFDGHDFVRTAFERGASAALVARDATTAAGQDRCLIEVDDTLSALGRLAAHWRARFDIPLIVVVGSNGKTTVKEMTAAILRAEHGEEHVLATRGNLNNAIGLPLTLLALRAEHRAAVIELGMNHPGETSELAAIAGPTIALINNAQREHQEFMQSVAEVAREHARLLPHVQSGGTAVFNADDAHAGVWRQATPSGVAIVDFAMNGPAAVHGACELDGSGMRLQLATPRGTIDTNLQVAGRHNASNALAAAAAAFAAGVSDEAIARGLQMFQPVPGRLVARRAMQGQTVIDDTYNANPDSVQAAIAVLSAAPAPRWLVLGDMGEVGSEGPAFHREAGTIARAAGIERLFTCGALAVDACRAFGSAGEHFDSVDALADDLAHRFTHDDARAVTVLVKGSRFMRMERVVARLCGDPAPGAH